MALRGLHAKGSRVGLGSQQESSGFRVSAGKYLGQSASRRAINPEFPTIFSHLRARVNPCVAHNYGVRGDSAELFRKAG